MLGANTTTSTTQTGTKPSSTQAAMDRRLTTVRPSELIPHIRALASTLESATPEQLRLEVLQVRRELARGHSTGEPHVLVAGLALACEALRRARNIRLYDVQLQAAMAMSRRCIAQMQTGEGKTFVAMTAAIHLSLAGRGVHVITPNVYLAERDQKLAEPVAAQLGLTVSLLPERVEDSKKAPTYDADITYGTGHEFGFDYLRDQLTLRQQAQDKLGSRLLQMLQPEASSRRTTMQRGLAYAVVDEADSVLIDDASSPLVLSFGSNQPAPDTDAHLIAKMLAETLQVDQDFLMDVSSGRIALTPKGIQRCHGDDVAIPVRQLVRPWTEYVIQALRARCLFRRDVHYVIREDEVCIVDESTGRIFEDRTWQDGLHQAIEAWCGLSITAEKQSVAQITRQRFFRLYEHLSGMTGTAVGCEQELHDVYNLEVEEIPLRVPSRRILHPPRFFASNIARDKAIAMSASQMSDAGRAVLIGTRSIADSEAIANELKQHGVPFQILNGLQNSEEAQIVSEAGRGGAITIATNLAGRGTDISLPIEVKAAGGLHVIVAECQASSRMDRQLIGRCARQGDPGSAQVFASAEDALVSMHGPWLAAALLRESSESGEVFADFSPQIRRIQASVERQQYASRIAMLKRDMHRDSLLNSTR